MKRILCPEMRQALERFENAVMAKMAIGAIPNEPIEAEYAAAKEELEIYLSYVP